MSTQNDTLAQLVTDVQSGDDLRIIEAAEKLLAMGDYGNPAGTYCLTGGKAALRKRKTADAVVLLYHGLKAVEPFTLLWGELLVNRAIACAHHGYFPDAIQAGGLFLNHVHSLPQQAEKWVPYVHHAVGLAEHRMQRPSQAAEHYRLAAELYTVPTERVAALVDLAYDLAICGEPDKGEEALNCVDHGVLTELGDLGNFGFHMASAVVRHFQGRYEDALATANKAKEIAQGREDDWAMPLTELHLWMSKMYWNLGDRYHAGAWALHAAYHAELKRLIALAQEANDWICEIMSQGGIRNA